MTNDSEEQMKIILSGYLALLPIDKKTMTFWNRRMNLMN